ncbi:hypothetical protein T01_5353, partial [Trichinella spiralis]
MFFDIIMYIVQYIVVFGLLGDKFSPPFLTGRSTRYLIGPSICRLISFPCLIAH